MPQTDFNSRLGMGRVAMAKTEKRWRKCRLKSIFEGRMSSGCTLYLVWVFFFFFQYMFRRIIPIRQQFHNPSWMHKKLQFLRMLDMHGCKHLWEIRGIPFHQTCTIFTFWSVYLRIRRFSSYTCTFNYVLVPTIKSVSTFFGKIATNSLVVVILHCQFLFCYSFTYDTLNIVKSASIGLKPLVSMYREQNVKIYKYTSKWVIKP